MNKDLQSPQSSDPAIESRSVRGIPGFIFLTLIVMFVAWWMTLQGRALQQAATPETIVPPAMLDGFDENLFYLPAEPMAGFIEIPAGSFLMGSDPAMDRQAYENERWSGSQRQGRVDLPGFYISRFEVTVAQYQSFVSATNHSVDSQSFMGGPDHPVTFVTWTDALAYCRWLEEMLLRSDATPASLRDLLNNGWHITLPSEAQWEKAARGINGDIYPWGNQLLPGVANFDSVGTVRVGSLNCRRCNYGLFDMSGNVWEFTSSPYQDYPYDESDDREYLTEDALWVMRGGSYTDAAGNIRTAVRGRVDPGVRNPTIGFRLALSASND